MLKSLRDRKDDAAFLAGTINSLSQLKELSFHASHGYREWNWDCWNDALRVPEATLNLSIPHLTTLDLTDLKMSLWEARRVILALTKNDTITDLTVPFSVFRCRLSEKYEPLVQYLKKEDCRLKRLTLKSKTECCALEETLVDALCRMKSLEELNVDIVLDIGYLIDMVALFTKVLTTNKTLRRLRLPSTMCKNCKFPEEGHTMCTFPQAKKCMQSLVAALRMPKFTLRELGIDLRSFDKADCHKFFKAVADNSVLESVTVYSLPRVSSVDRICGKICSCGLSDRVTIRNICVDKANVEVLLYCPEITVTTVTARHFEWTQYEKWRAFDLATASRSRWTPYAADLPEVNSALNVIRRCSHVTSLRVNCESFDRAAFSALAACVRSPSVLTDIEIDFGPGWTELADEERQDIQAELVSALASNRNLARLSFRGALLSRNDLYRLAGGAYKSRYLTDFCLIPACISDDADVGSCAWHAAELTNLPPGEYKNAALLAMQEITRRNICLVHAAVQYVLSEADNDTGARVIEMMRSHPRLLELVQEAAGRSKVKAKMMIRDAVSRIRQTSLNEFMRLAAVVKKKVECFDNCDAGKQIVDLSGPCWLRVRSFLRIADVRA
ncbi:hypothetical protein MTO96_039451 [Rhipicephalus appendiculatus]